MRYALHNSPVDNLEEKSYRPLVPLEESRVPVDRPDLLQGTLEMLVLKALSLEPMHGWGIGQRIDQLSRDVFRVNQGSLYPALQRMLRKGWIRAEWRVTENNRRARYYSITASGRRRLEEEAATWERVSAAVNWILRGRPAAGTA
jgi:transcriptional regulator